MLKPSLQLTDTVVTLFGFGNPTKPLIGFMMKKSQIPKSGLARTLPLGTRLEAKAPRVTRIPALFEIRVMLPRQSKTVHPSYTADLEPYNRAWTQCGADDPVLGVMVQLKL